jgi:acetoin:2,6-dichlorophenolindophenol oxidoreductase subunit alpha
MGTVEQLGRAELLDLYRCMVRIRSFEEHAHKAFLKGGMPGFLHLYSGEEAIAAGVMAVLHDDDYIVTSHRGHGHLLARGGDPRRMFAELYGRVDGYCHGKGGSMHIADMSHGMLGANGIVGAAVNIGTGAAFACKYRGERRVSVAFFGDGSTNRGTFHEALNLAAIWNLPAVYILENNHYAVANPQSEHTKLKNLADRAAAYGFPGLVVDGNDVLAVREATTEAIERARAGGGPTLIECKTWRHWGHFIGDSAKYRDPAEHEAWLKRDPIAAFAKVLADQGVATEAELQAIQREADAEMDSAIEYGRQSPFPDKAELTKDVYVGDVAGSDSAGADAGGRT